MRKAIYANENIVGAAKLIEAARLAPPQRLRARGGGGRGKVDLLRFPEGALASYRTGFDGCRSGSGWKVTWA